MCRIFILLVLCLPLLVAGQKDYVQDVIPTIGDKFSVSVDFDFEDIDVKEDYTGKLSWDFSSLQSDISNDYKISPLSESVDDGLFADADFFIRNGESEEFYKVIDVNKKNISKMVIQLGIIGQSDFSLGLDIASRVEGQNVHHFSKIKYGDTFTDADFNFEYIMETAMLPDSITNRFSAYGIDSIKVSSVLDGDFYVSGYGTLKIPSGVFDVVRVESTTNIKTRLDAFSPTLGGWFNVPQDFLSGEIASVFGDRTLKQYLFYADGYHWPIANVYTLQTNFGPYQNDKVVYHDPKLVSTKNPSFDPSDIEAYPNPTFGDVVFKRNNTTMSNRVNIYNVIGKKLNSYQFKPGKDSLEVNLSHLQKGTYVYSLVDDKGRRLTSKRLIILNP